MDQVHRTGPPFPTVLYIDDEYSNRQTFKAVFRTTFQVLLAADLSEALSVLQQQEVQVVISDQRMPDVTGCEALRRIKGLYPRVKRMLITAHADLHTLVDALNQAGVCHYIQKPWDAEEVRVAVLAAWEEYKAENERSAYTERLIESNRQLEFALRQSLLS